jgi:hypothetical protein
MASVTPSSAITVIPSSEKTTGAILASDEFTDMLSKIQEDKELSYYELYQMRYSLLCNSEEWLGVLQSTSRDLGFSENYFDGINSSTRRNSLLLVLVALEYLIHFSKQKSVRSARFEIRSPFKYETDSMPYTFAMRAAQLKLIVNHGNREYDESLWADLKGKDFEKINPFNPFVGNRCYEGVKDKNPGEEMWKELKEWELDVNKGISKSKMRDRAIDGCKFPIRFMDNLTKWYAMRETVVLGIKNNKRKEPSSENEDDSGSKTFYFRYL